jgi:hypothetical protein
MLHTTPWSIAAFRSLRLNRLRNVAGPGLSATSGLDALPV